MKKIDVVDWLLSHDDKGRHEYNDTGRIADHIVTFANGDIYVARTIYGNQGNVWFEIAKEIYINGEKVA